jgi:DUF917 family protein
MTDPTPPERTLSEVDLEDIVNGACLYGAGGGGPWSLGMTLVEEIVASGQPVVLAHPASMAAGSTACVSAGVGSPEAAASGFPYFVASRAFDALGALQDTPFSHVLPPELGATNSIVPMTVAAARGVRVLDAAGSPRAVPELEQSTFAAAGAPVGTVVLANSAQRVSFDGHDPASTDRTMRQIISSGVFSEDAGAALWAMDAATVARAAMAGTTTRARALGAALRAARAAGDDPVAAVTTLLGGRVLARGHIVSSTEQTAGGFDVGVLTVETNDGARLRIVNQNENMLAWPEGSTHPVALAPDLVCCMTLAGQPFSNADLKLVQGEDIAVIGAPVDPAYRQPAIVTAFMPVLRAAGYGGPYLPIDRLWG